MNLETHMKKVICGNLVKFTFDDNVAPLTFDCTKVSGANRAYAIPFAFMHRLGDAAALSRTLPDGTVRTITEAMRRGTVAEVATHYESGSADWDVKGRGVAQSPVILTIATKLGISYEEAQAKIAEQFLGELGA